MSHYIRERPAPVTSVCGFQLTDCRCHAHTGPRPAWQLDQLHCEAVARAYASGWGHQPAPAHVLAALGVVVRNDWWAEAA